MSDLDARVAALMRKVAYYRYAPIEVADKKIMELEQALRVELQTPALQEPCTELEALVALKNSDLATEIYAGRITPMQAAINSVLQGRAKPAPPVGFGRTYGGCPHCGSSKCVAMQCCMPDGEPGVIRLADQVQRDTDRRLQLFYSIVSAGEAEKSAPVELPVVAVNKEWADKDMSILIHCLRTTTNFDAVLIGEMLEYAKQAAIAARRKV